MKSNNIIAEEISKGFQSLTNNVDVLYDSESGITYVTSKVFAVDDEPIRGVGETTRLAQVNLIANFITHETRDLQVINDKQSSLSPKSLKDDIPIYKIK